MGIRGGRKHKYPCWEIFRGRKKKLYFRYRAANGQIVVVSEGYTRRHNVMKGIRAVQRGDPTIVDLTLDAA